MQKYDTVELWLDYLLKHKRKQTTIDSYRAYLNRCLDVLEDAGRTTDPCKINEGDLFFIETNLNVKEDTRRAYLNVLDQWLVWYNGESILDECDILWNTTSPDRLFIEEEDLQELLKVADERDTLILLLEIGRAHV